jgi:hypothetical protein
VKLECIGHEHKEWACAFESWGKWRSEELTDWKSITTEKGWLMP